MRAQHPFGKLSLCMLTILLLRLGTAPPSLAEEPTYDPHRIMMARGHYESALKLMVKNRPQEAEAEYLEAIRLFPDYAEAHMQLGSLSMARKDYSEALARLLRAKQALTNLQGLRRQQEMERQRRIQ